MSELGWAAYGITVILSAVGKNRLMPPADFSCLVINGENGYVRQNSSWVIGRVVRDFDVWKDKQRPAAAKGNTAKDAGGPVAKCVESILDRKWEIVKKKAKEKGRKEPERPPRAGLCVSVYKARRARKGHAGHDAPYVTGCLTCVLQLAVAVIPCGVYGDWSVLLTTIAGIALALATGSLPQWEKEKWACRDNARKTVVLTAGNGSQHAIVVQGAGRGLDLEDLAVAKTHAPAAPGTWVLLVALGLLWVLLLVTATGIAERTWYLLAVGGLGIAQNLYAAGAARSPEAFGMPLEFVEVLGEPKVMDTLFAVERRYPGLGRTMLSTFFTAGLTKDEQDAWDSLESVT